MKKQTGVLLKTVSDALQEFVKAHVKDIIIKAALLTMISAAVQIVQSTDAAMDTSPNRRNHPRQIIKQ